MVVVSVVFVFFGGIGIVMSITNFDEVNDSIKDIWSNF